MGQKPSSVKDDNDMAKFFCRKKITTKRPIYLTENELSYDTDNKYLYLSLCEQDWSKKPFIKLKAGMTFFIDDVISYCHNEGGVFTYQAWIHFTREIKEDDILEIKFSDDIEDRLLIDKIYNEERGSLILEEVNKITYCSLYTFMEQMNADRDYMFTGSALCKYKDIYEFQELNEKYPFIFEKLSSKYYYKNYDRINNYKLSIGSYLCEMNCLFFIIIFIFIVCAVIWSNIEMF